MLIYSFFVSFFFLFLFSFVASCVSLEEDGGSLPKRIPPSDFLILIFSVLDPSFDPYGNRKKEKISCLFSFFLFILTRKILRESQGQLFNWYPDDFVNTFLRSFLHLLRSDITNFLWSSCELCPADPSNLNLMRNKNERNGLEFHPFFLISIMVRKVGPEHERKKNL